MKSIIRKYRAWRRRIEKERSDRWMARYKLYSSRAFARLSPVPETSAGALAKVERLERHLRRLHAVQIPLKTGRLDLRIDFLLRNFTLWPRISSFNS